MNSHQEILHHFKADEKLFQAISALHDEIRPEIDIDIYQSLLSSIVSQQLSTKVVKVIWKRFTDLFPDSYPAPDMLLAKDHEVLRGVGLSNSKANYVKNVAEFSLENDVTFDFLQLMSDKEIIEYLTRIKGVGTWTVQMILMFPMDRPDVFPVDDLGIQNSMKKLYEIDLEKKELKKRMHEISQHWSPFRTVASKYLWKLLEV